MIVTTTRHGRTARDTRYLLAHLSSEKEQRSRVVHVAAPVATAPEALDYMSALRDGSRTTVAYHHLSLSPSQPLTDEQRDEAVARILSALGAEDHAHVVWEHSGKGRRGLSVDTHYHVVVSHVGPDSRALDDGRSYVRLEAVARSLEHDFGHDLTPGRRTAAVAAELERLGRHDVAARVRGEAPPEPPASAMSSRQRARAERHGVSLPDVCEAVRQAWEASDSPAALRTALAEAGLGVAPGDKPGVWVVSGPDCQILGALDRLAGQRRRAVQARMKQEETTHDAEVPAPCHEGPESDVRRGPSGPRGSPGIEPASGAPGPSRARRGFAAGGGDGVAADDPRDTGAVATGDRGAGRPPQRGQAALAVAALARATQDPAVRKAQRGAQQLHRPRGRDMLDARRLARIDLDDLRRMAEDIGRRAAAFLARLTHPTPHSPRRYDPREALRMRLHEAASSPCRAAASVHRSAPEESSPAHRPRF